MTSFLFAMISSKTETIGKKVKLKPAPYVLIANAFQPSKGLIIQIGNNNSDILNLLVVKSGSHLNRSVITSLKLNIETIVERTAPARPTESKMVDARPAIGSNVCAIVPAPLQRSL